MKQFARRGFQLRSASLETRVTYTGFLVLMVLGMASFLALSVGRMGLSPAAVAVYYRGGEDEMSFPRTFWQLMEVSHFHLFSMPVVVLILTHLLFATPYSQRLRLRLTLAAYVGVLLDITGPWAVRYVAAGFAWWLLAGWLLLGLSGLVIVLLTLLAMWAPDRWLAGLAPETRAAQQRMGGES